MKTTRDYAPEQHNALAAKALYETARAAADAEIALLVEPEVGADDDASLAYELAVIAIENAHEVDGLRRLCRCAEDALIDWAIGHAQSVGNPAFAEVMAVLPTMRRHLKYRTRLVDTALRLAA